MRSWSRMLGLLVVAAALQGVSMAAPPKTIDQRLREAEKFIAASDKYLHQSKLKRGMGGYGLTVMAGTGIQKFNVTVVSVMRNWYPHQDVILCKLAGLGLEKSGIVSGMSGSPVYIKDPADGKHKLIGAVAYGWRFQKDPVAGIQPIAQMLAVEGVPLGGAEKPAAKEPASPSAAAVLDEDFVRAMLDPRKLDFSAFCRPANRRRRAGSADGAAGLVPLATPVMISGAGPRTMALARQLFAGAGLVPLRAGAVGAAEADAARKTKLAPGSALSVILVSGDMDWSAVGTVTDVIGDRVLAFGHSMFAEGRVRLPMGTAYVHTVISSTMSSFKLSSTLKATGALTHDEYTGISGQVGAKAEMVPMTVTVNWPAGQQKFSYNVVRHRWMTPGMSRMALSESVLANRDIPERHTLEYDVDIDFEKFGRYRSANTSSGGSFSAAASDVSRPLAALMNTALGKPVFPRSIEVTVTIKPVQTTADILSLELDRNVYRPGEKVTGKVTLRPFRSPRITKAVSIDLPKDLPDGRRKLTVCDSYQALSATRSELPHRFTPKTVEGLFAAIKEVVAPRMDRLYLRLPLPAGGLAVRKNELEHLPGSMAELLSRAAPMDTKLYRRSKVVSFPAGFVVRGSASASFTVEKEPRRK